MCAQVDLGDRARTCRAAQPDRKLLQMRHTDRWVRLKRSDAPNDGRRPVLCRAHIVHKNLWPDAPAPWIVERKRLQLVRHWIDASPDRRNGFSALAVSSVRGMKSGPGGTRGSCFDVALSNRSHANGEAQ